MQLEAVHGASTSGVTSLDELLGGSRASIFGDGLGGLKSDQLRKLLVNPRLLLDLQEALLLEGGPYWSAPKHRAGRKIKNICPKVAAASNGFWLWKPQRRRSFR